MEEKKYKYKTANQSYYRIASKKSDNLITRTDVPLFVNCCGESVIREDYYREFHHNDYEIIYMLGGRIEICEGTDKYFVKKGDVMIFSPGKSRSFRVSAPMEEWARYYWIHFTGYDVEQVLALCDLPRNGHFTITPATDIMDLYERMFAEFRTRQITFDYATELTMRTILLFISRLRAGVKRGKLDRSIRHIHTHIRYDLSVEALASMEFLGVSRYRELFREETGVSPSEYISRLRIERAKDLLGQGDMSIDDVAAAVGYSDRHYFQRIFKKSVGVTPGEYRRNMR